MYQMTDDEFEAAIDEALEGLPPRFLKALDNVGIAMEDEPDEDQLEMAEYGTEDQASGELLGLYDGIPLTERGEGYCSSCPLVVGGHLVRLLALWRENRAGMRVFPQIRGRP